MHQIRTSTYGLIELAPYDTRNHSGLLLAGSEITQAEGAFGLILSQRYQNEQFSILVNQFRFRKKTSVVYPIHRGSLQSISCIKGHGQQRLDGGKFSLRTGQYFLAVPNNDFQEVQVERDKEYWNFVVSYESALLDPLLPYFPVLKLLLTERNGKKPHNRVLWMDKHICNLIEQVMHSFYEPALRDFMYKERVDDLLHSMLIESGRQPMQLKNLSGGDIEKIYQARALILENVKEHHNIEDLSRKVELNEFKIKEGFRQLFGKGPFGILKDARMQIAHDLLLHTNRPEKDIMTEAGYTSLTAFVKAFRSVYGIPPGQLRVKSSD